MAPAIRLMHVIGALVVNLREHIITYTLQGLCKSASSRDHRFGFAAAWLGGYVGRKILTQALSSEFIGFAGAMLSALASALSLALGVGF